MEKLSDLSESQRYYLDGFIKERFKKTPTLEKCNDILNNLIESDDLNEGFFWEEKYRNTKDLRPNCFEYDSCFVDLLIENNLHNKIKNLTKMDYTLSHIQIRKSNCKDSSYMPWHRDSYTIDDNLVGNIPPSHKIIFYPKVRSSNSNQDTPRLSILKGTHRCIYTSAKSNEFIIPGFSNYDNEFAKIHGRVDYKPSKDEFIIFDTSALHHANIDDNDTGYIRVIYSFVLDFQFKEKYSMKPEHEKLNSIFREMSK